MAAMRWAVLGQLLVQSCLAELDILALVQTSLVRRAAQTLDVRSVVHPWANKNGDLNHSGFSPHVAPFDLSSPTWTFKMPIPGHTSPMIDNEKNVYVTNLKLGVVSLDKYGKVRWTNSLGAVPGNAFLSGSDVFVCSSDGKARALDSATGAQRWETKVGNNCAGDAWSISGAGSTVIIPTNTFKSKNTDGSCDLVALNTTDGRRIWEYSLCFNGLPKGYNLMPSIVDGGVIFQDMFGGVHRISLATGVQEWSRKVKTASMTTGGMATGPNGLLYGASNYKGDCDQGKGKLQAVDVKTGTVRWERTFQQGLNSGPAVGRLGRGGRLAVIAQVADNFLHHGIVVSMIMDKLGKAAPPAPVHKGTVMALDAETGQTIWSYDVDDFQGWSYLQQSLGCLPDSFGNPSIGGDGTVYVNWSGGFAYAIRDADGDGVISKQEVTRVDTQSGMNGETAIAPGMVVVPSCDAVRGYLAA